MPELLNLSDLFLDKVDAIMIADALQILQPEGEDDAAQDEVIARKEHLELTFRRLGMRS